MIRNYRHLQRFKNRQNQRRQEYCSSSVGHEKVQCIENFNNCYIIARVAAEFQNIWKLKTTHFYYLKNFVFYLEEYAHSLKNKFTTVQSHSVLLWAQFVSQAPVVIHILVFK